MVTILRQILNLPVVTKELSRKNQSFTSSPPIYNVIRAAQSLVVLKKKIVVCLFDLLYCLSLDVRLLITPVVSSDKLISITRGMQCVY